MPTVSVIIPAYNSAATLPQCLQSVFAQTLKDIEIIVVDDGSTDETPSILEMAVIPRPKVEESPTNVDVEARISVIRQVHQGAATARNRGAALATAPYLFFCDADLELDRRILEQMVNVAARRSDVSFVYCGFEWGRRTFGLRPFDAEEVRRNNYISTMSLIRREHFPGFDESLARFQDWDLWLTMIERRHRGIGIPLVLFRVQFGPAGMSRRGGLSRILATWRVRKKHGLKMRVGDFVIAMKETLRKFIP